MPKYMVTDGVKYLRQNLRGNYCLVNKKDATIWNTQNQALNALNNAICKPLRDRYCVKKLNTEIPLENVLEADTSDFERWILSIGSFERFIDSIETLKEDLKAELFKVNNEMCDLLHYIEFGKLNACQGWEAAEMMKNTRQQRRKIKDAMYIVDEILKGKGRGKSEYKSAQVALSCLNNRKYTPRTLNFLFEGTVIVCC